jgi:DnaJ like chaperone protein
MRFLVYLLGFLYALSPYDLVPDFIVGAGWVDDLIILGLLGWYHFIYRRKKYRYQQNYQGYRQSTEANQERFREGESFNPYQVLGIKKDASSEEIKAAYKRLAIQYHPDKVTHLGEEFKILAEKRFKEIQEAYQQLKGDSS